jgi:hypothetical protein
METTHDNKTSQAQADDPLRPHRDGAASIIGAAFAWCPAASAQPYPSRPIHIIVPFAAGGITDVIGRALGQRLAEAFGHRSWSRTSRVAARPESAPNMSRSRRRTATPCW